MWLTELNRSVYRTGWHTLWSVENLAENSDDDFFSVVSYIMKIMFYIRYYPNETTMVMNCDADAMNMGYSHVQRCQTQFYIQT